MDLVVNEGVEFDPQKSAELLAATLDVLYYDAMEERGADLWNGGGITTKLKSNDSPIKSVGFFPVPLSKDTEIAPNHKVGIFVVSGENTEPLGTIGIECDFTDNGHTNLKGNVVPATKISKNDLLGASVSLGASIIALRHP